MFQLLSFQTDKNETHTPSGSSEGTFSAADSFSPQWERHQKLNESYFYRIFGVKFCSS